ncbi:AAA family ATPase [Oceanospirillum beijerinckii]|uniref:AAA family ATPase n=1 Tax=Oceanospirillum beijerinckii TaxID=64976 RepID=UPI000488E5C5|nr:ATP-binding protein [Oceanospirillum beijerinckii]
MGEQLKVRNFLVLKKVDMDIKKVNVVIGPQANGKSVIAKLVYFFQELSANFVDSIRKQITKKELDKTIVESFESKFPRYSWDGSSFEIDYFIGGISISIYGERNSRGKTRVKVKYCSDLARIFLNKKRSYKKRFDQYMEQEGRRGRIVDLEHMVLYECVLDPLRESEYSCFFSDSVFIPATRSFFANLQKNIFTFLASNLDIDPFLKDFGRLYENSKRMYKDGFLFRRNKGLADELSKSLEAIVSGDYEYHDEQDWIVSKGKKINLANASSGQQESLPMLLVLCILPLIKNRNSEHGMFFIEEPEAHLFPTSQGHIVSILSLLYEHLSTNFFITSHSPYILSALNNFILASDVVRSGGISESEFAKLNGGGKPIKFEDVSAYTIESGVSKSICDDEYRMVGGDMLDDISGHFENVMNQLLTLGDN